jgi:YD repeat-containing protein
MCHQAIIKTIPLLNKRLVMTNYVKNTTKIAITCLVLLLSQLSFSKEKNWEVVAPLVGNQIAVNNSITLMDPEINNTNYVLVNNKVFVELGIDNFLPPFYWYKANVTLKVTPLIDANTTANPYEITLSVENNRYGGFGNFIDLEKHLVSGVNTRGVSIEVITVDFINKDANQQFTSIPGDVNNLKLTVKIESERYYFFTENMVPSITANYNANNRTIDFSWNHIDESEEYELEWTWVDNYGDHSSNTFGVNPDQNPLDAAQINLSIKDFEINNTRIQTKNNYFSIPDTYDRGYIIYRIRAVGRFTSQPSNLNFSLNEIVRKPFYSYWSGNPSAKNISEWNAILIQNHSKINWQFQASYAENGKKKEVVSYFDGSLRNRQTVTKINTNSKTIVGEVIYDNEGRPSIEILPTPIQSNVIQYFPSLNKNMNNYVYSYQDFDLSSTNNCSPSAGPMNPISGSSLYYSPQNTLSNTFQDYVPVANNFPFSQTQYSKDNTGRVIKKGGVGSEFQIGSGHEMKYFYNVPGQSELNRLFGYYVGNATHYKKNAVIDPNGQLSVSYIDPKGKTIATALAADSPKNLQSLNDPNSIRNIMVDDLLNKVDPDNFDTDADNNIKYASGYFGNLNDGLNFSAQKVLTAIGHDYNFNYALRNNPDKFTFNCDKLNQSISYPFIYNIDINLKDECNNNLIPSYPNGIKDTIGSYTSNNGILTTASGLPNYTKNFTLSLPNIGTYSITKNLKVDPQALDLFANDFIEKAKNNGCILAKPNPTIDDSGCYSSCQECAHHYDNLSYTENGATYSGINAYVHQMMSTLETQYALGTSEYNFYDTKFRADWNLLKNKCLQFCNNTNASPYTYTSCSPMLDLFLMDVLPGGQYGSNISNQQLSIYNDQNQILAPIDGHSTTAGNNNWRNPDYFDAHELLSAGTNKNHYFTNAGQIAYVDVIKIDNTTYSPAVKQQYLNQVIQSNGTFKVEPQYLDDVFVFIDLIKNNKSWALSLVKYHPEFHYLEYDQQYCKDNFKKTLTLKDGNQYIVNSEGFDRFISELDYTRAENLDLLLSETSLLDKDPLFSTINPLDGAKTLSNGTQFSAVTSSNPDDFRQKKYMVMEEALKEFKINNTTGYSHSLYNTHPMLTIFGAAFEFVHSLALSNSPICLNNFTCIKNSLTQSEKDKFWQKYVAFYISLKQNIKNTFLAVHANENGAFNGCIGPTSSMGMTTITNSSDVIANLNYHPTTKTFLTNEINNNTTTPNVCSTNTTLLIDKTKRYLLQPATPSVLEANNIVAQATSYNYQQTGVCPRVADLQQFFNNAVQYIFLTPVFKGLGTSNSVSLPVVNNLFTNDLFTAGMNGSYNINTITMYGYTNASINPTTLVIHTNQNNNHLKTITLNIDSNATIDWTTYNNTGSNGWHIESFSNLVFTNYSNQSDTYNFSVLVKVKLNNSNDIVEYIFTGSTPFSLTCAIDGNVNASTNQGDPVLLPADTMSCDTKKDFTSALFVFLKSINNINSTTEIVINNLPPYLKKYFGIESNGTAKWRYDGNGIYHLIINRPGSTVDTGVMFDLSQTTNYLTSSNVVLNTIAINYNSSFGVYNYEIEFNTSAGKCSAIITRASNQKLYFNCNSCCGAFDLDGDGIGDDGNFSTTSCDNYDDASAVFVCPPNTSNTMVSSYTADLIAAAVDITSLQFNTSNPDNLILNPGVIDQMGIAMFCKFDFQKIINCIIAQNSQSNSCPDVHNWPTGVSPNFMCGISNGGGGISLNWEPSLPSVNYPTIRFHHFGCRIVRSISNPVPPNNGDYGYNEDYTTPLHESNLQCNGPTSLMGFSVTLGRNCVKYYTLQQFADFYNSSCGNTATPVTTNNNYHCSTCIPQVVSPVICIDAYTDYVNHMANISGFTNPYTQTSFCNLNLQYLVNGYLDYLIKFGVNNVQDPYYITITAYGNTALNYGNNHYAAVNNAYHTYNNTTPPTITWSDFVDLYLKQSANLKLCSPRPMIPVVPALHLPSPNCNEFNLSITNVYNNENYANYLIAKKEEFKRLYLQQAIENAIENFTMTFEDKEHQYTLYYYDQAGNLIQTVAPEGVQTLSSAANTAINNLRANLPNNEDSSLLPSHNLKTLYRYNSLNQLVWQQTPDGGETRFAYDELGRIVASQNEKQLNNKIINNPPVSESALLKTAENIIFNIGRDADYRETFGSSLDDIPNSGSIEHTIVVDEKYPLDSYNRILFGFGNERSPEVELLRYAFISEKNGTFRIRSPHSNLETTYNFENGDKLKIARDNGIIRFYKNGMQLLQDIDVFEDKPMFLNYYLPQSNNHINNLKIAYSNILKDFSYTCYDPLGRINQAGQFKAKTNIYINDNGKLVYSNNDQWVSVNEAVSYPHNVSKNQYEVTKTLYDDFATFDANYYLGTTADKNSRGRVTAILTFDITDIGTPLEKNETAIFYSYDIHGNVNKMAQRISPTILNVPNNPDGVVKRVNYEYDLISGNVNKVVFQKDVKKEQFIHRYNYDADNRITYVETSQDGVIWERDASYQYYDHGPFAKVITGDKEVQGSDYAYTLQGWLKAVNSENFATNNKDMGYDGNHVSKDAYGFSLSYFKNDYNARNQGNNNAYAISNSNGTIFEGVDLFNGNIKRMITSVRGIKEEILPTQVNLYTYDQLNRIFEMHSFNGIQSNDVFNPIHSYASNYSYDKNGNLKTLFRSAPLKNPDGSESIVPMDNFTYNYQPNTNKLTHINDDPSIDSNTFDTDIDNQINNNYQYDQIGQLVKDNAENIDNIQWRVDGKVKSIQKNGNEQIINFFYDGLGNRIAKQVTNSEKGTSTTEYDRDAQGNVLGVYTLNTNGEKETAYTLSEHHIYGSSRIGLQEYYVSKEPNDYYRLVGDKRYELSNHLGNVLSVINDRKIVNKEIELIATDPIEELAWKNESKCKGELFVNKINEKEFKGSWDNSIKIKRIIDLKDNEETIIQLNINRPEDFPANAVVTFSIINAESKNVELSYNVPQNGIIATSFTPISNGARIVEIAVNEPNLINENGETINPEPINFSLNNFYVYLTPHSPIDFTSLYLPDVLNYNDYYPFGSIIPLSLIHI